MTMDGLDTLRLMLRYAEYRARRHDSLTAIDLFDATGRLAIQAFLATQTSDPEEVRALREDAKRCPVTPLVLVHQRSVPEGVAVPTALVERMAACVGVSGADPEFGTAEALHDEFLEAYRLAFPWLVTIDERDGTGALEIARRAYEALLVVSPVPLVLEPVRVHGSHDWDKDRFVVGTGQAYQDGGFAYDLRGVEERLLAIARAYLPAAAQAPYYQRVAQRAFDQGDLDEAERLLRTSLELHPNADCHNALLRCLLASPTADEAQFFAESRRWASLYANEGVLKSIRYDNVRERDKVLRVGYLCDFLETPLAQHTLVPQFEAHDRSRVQVCTYNAGPDTAMVRAVSDLYRHTRGVTSDTLYDLIRSDGIDVLVDLNGRLRPLNHYDVLCRKPAPLLVNWYNLLASTGLRAFDFLVSDPVSLPRCKQQFCTEEIFYTECESAGAWQLPEDPPVAPVPAMRGERFTFSCFGHAFKLNEAVLELFARVLRETGDSRLYLKNISFYSPEFRRRVRDWFVSRGIPETRLRLEHGSRFSRMRALYADVDLALDTFPYGNGSTTINAAWQGVPTLSLLWPEWRGRTSASIMLSAGLPEFVVHDQDEYIARAKEFFARPDLLVPIRSQMRAKLSKTGYFDIPRFTRALEDGFRAMWHAWLDRTAGQDAM